MVPSTVLRSVRLVAIALHYLAQVVLVWRRCSEHHDASSLAGDKSSESEGGPIQRGRPGGDRSLAGGGASKMELDNKTTALRIPGTYSTIAV